MAMKTIVTFTTMAMLMVIDYDESLMVMVIIRWQDDDGNGDNTMATMMREFDALCGLWWSAGAWDWKGLRPHKPNRITKQRG